MKPISSSLFGLLCFSVWINYIDRGTLSVAAPVLQPELGITPGQMGILLSGFFWTYALLQPALGIVVDRFGAYRLYALGYAVWSVAVALGGLSQGFGSLLASRLLLGVGESVAYPCFSRIISTGFAENRRGIANAMIDVGTKVGPALGTFLGGMLINSYGWRPFFFWMGAASLIWLVPWMKMIPKEEPALAVRPEDQVPMSKLLTQWNPWITFLGLFGFNYAFYFLLTWLPSYLVNERKFSMEKMAILGALPFCATAVSAVLTAMYADWKIAHGAPSANTRRRLLTIGLVIAGTTLFGATLESQTLAMACMIVAFVGLGMFTANCWAITQTLCSTASVGAWTGCQNCVGNMGGVVAPIVTGFLVQQTGTYAAAFLAASAMLFFSAILYGFLLRSTPEHPLRAQA
ncbi:MFS transporter [Bryobacter aggregatus]|uniref:MFS transporter n=1 Tax=Bryobacter aggregatus TaxID=360054 RepID=UPI00068BF1D4|nr:MFS transporter [Bryobacter aggregatus]